MMNWLNTVFQQSKTTGTLLPIPSLCIVRKSEQGLNSLTLVNSKINLAGFCGHRIVPILDIQKF